MAFTWKGHKDIWKGEGIYHLTWTVVNRTPILGTVEPLAVPDDEGHEAWTRATPLGKAVLAKINELEVRYPQLEIIWKQLMPDHLHTVVWAHEGFEESIKMVARGYGQGCSKIARRYAGALSVDVAQSDCAFDTNKPSHLEDNDNKNTHDPYDCGNGAHTLFNTPFIRTLSHRRQLDKMVKYVKNNPDSKWREIHNPDLYTIRRNEEHAGLHFDCMGKARLLDYPERNVVALSRSLTPEQIEVSSPEK